MVGAAPAVIADVVRLGQKVERRISPGARTAQANNVPAASRASASEETVPEAPVGVEVVEHVHREPLRGYGSLSWGIHPPLWFALYLIRTCYDDQSAYAGDGSLKRRGPDPSVCGGGSGPTHTGSFFGGTSDGAILGRYWRRVNGNGGMTLLITGRDAGVASIATCNVLSSRGHKWSASSGSTGCSPRRHRAG